MAQFAGNKIQARKGNERAVSIRQDLIEGRMTNKQIAEKYGVSGATVSQHLSRLRKPRPQVLPASRHGDCKWSIVGGNAVYTNRVGDTVTVSLADYPEVSSGSIGISRDYGGYKTVYIKFDGGKRLTLARYLLGAGDGQLADHINGDSTDNRRENLRLCSRGENTKSRRKEGREGSSKYKGVVPQGAKWRANITANGKLCRIGVYATEEEAARAYDEFARALHGEFACLNFPQADERPALRVVGGE